MNDSNPYSLFSNDRHPSKRIKLIPAIIISTQSVTFNLSRWMSSNRTMFSYFVMDSVGVWMRRKLYNQKTKKKHLGNYTVIGLLLTHTYVCTYVYECYACFEGNFIKKD